MMVICYLKKWTIITLVTVCIMNCTTKIKCVYVNDKNKLFANCISTKCLFNYSISLRGLTAKILRFQQRHKHELSDNYSLNYQKSSQNPLIEDINLKANIFSFIAMEILFYPVETIIHRLHIQVTDTTYKCCFSIVPGISVSKRLTNNYLTVLLGYKDNNRQFGYWDISYPNTNWLRRVCGLLQHNNSQRGCSWVIQRLWCIGTTTSCPLGNY